ncbi:MAG: GtrA family protein, partial [Sulfolobaceae archaeon]
MSKKELILRLVKFGIVGALGTIVNEGLLYLFTKIFPIAMSLIFSIEISIIFNFILNDVWTFKDRRFGNFGKRLIRFHITAVVGGIIQYMIVLLLIVVGWRDQALLILLSSYSHLPSIILIINLIGIISAFI